MTCGRMFVGLDVGGTTIKAAVVDNSGRIVGQAIAHSTEADGGAEHGLQVMAEAIRRVVANASLSVSDIAAIGVATPGPLDIPAGMMLDPPNLPGWHNVPVRDFI